MDNIIKFLENSNWINAKTYQSFAPHEYIIIENNSRDIILEIGKIIYEKNINTISYYRWKREWRCLYLEPYIYWFHAKPLNNTHVNALYNKDWNIVTIDKYFNDVKVLNRRLWKI
jgi:hypothetical protein